MAGVAGVVATRASRQSQKKVGEVRFLCSLAAAPVGTPSADPEPGQGSNPQTQKGTPGGFSPNGGCPADPES